MLKSGLPEVLPKVASALSLKWSAFSDLSHCALFEAPVKVTSSFNVEVPETSTLALISTLPPYVETPATLT